MENNSKPPGVLDHLPGCPPMVVVAACFGSIAALGCGVAGWRMADGPRRGPSPSEAAAAADQEEEA